MNVHRLCWAQRIPIAVDEAWEFFSAPENLASITPPWLNFTILARDAGRGGEMYAGMVIRYTIRPFPGIRLHWLTEITHADRPRFFVDEQRFGPYRFWHHQHIFTEVDGGTEVTDIVHYGLPFGIIGDFFHVPVSRKLSRIFDYRRQTLVKMFGAMDEKGLSCSVEENGREEVMRG